MKEATHHLQSEEKLRKSRKNRKKLKLKKKYKCKPKAPYNTSQFLIKNKHHSTFNISEVLGTMSPHIKF